jgi:hypothetical protein
MEKYMFIFHGGDTSNLSPDKQQSNMQQWFAWVEKLKKENRYVAGEALVPGGKSMSGTKKVVTDGPFAESKELVGGFFVIMATTIDEAMSIAKEYPDFDLGGTIEVREIVKFDM